MTLDEKSLVLSCTIAGTIIRVLRDDLGLGARVPPGAPLTALVDPDAVEKTTHFLAEVQARQSAYDWEITVPLEGRLQALHFGGVQVEDGCMVVVARTRNGLERLHEELMRINNEQANALRAASKEIARPPARTGHDDTHFDELTRVNNELANLQRELARQNAELARLNEHKNRFLGMAAHDLRSPLGVILSYSEFLETEATALSAEQREFVSTIKETSEFMLKLVEDLLDVTTIEAGRLELERKPTDLAALVARTVALNRTLAATKNISITFTAPPAAGPVLALDPGKMQQVLNNLLGNAVKYSHRNTRVDVALGVAATSVMLTVRDQGQGIPAEDLSKLFKPFGKTRVRGTAGELSTGLGLMIVRRIVEGHGGHIEVESEVGRGTAFHVTLPLPTGNEADAVRG